MVATLVNYHFIGAPDAGVYEEAMRYLVASLLIVASTAAADPDDSGEVVGVITDDAGTVAGATVRFAATGHDPVYVATDRDGKYRATLPDGMWIVSVGDSEHAPRATAVEVAASAPRAVDLRLERGPTRAIEGVVRKADGTAVAGARVEAQLVRASSDEPVATTVSDSAGRYRLVLVNSRHELELAVHARGLAPADGVAASLLVDHVDFALHDPAAIEGVVRNAAGRPVPHARVTAMRHTLLRLDDAGPTRTIVADGDGAFAIADLAAGTVELTVGSGPAVLVQLATAERVTGIVLRAASK